MTTYFIKIRKIKKYNLIGQFEEYRGARPISLFGISRW